MLCKKEKRVGKKERAHHDQTLIIKKIKNRQFQTPNAFENDLKRILINLILSKGYGIILTLDELKR